jgi:hypothetical protein
MMKKLAGILAGLCLSVLAFGQLDITKRNVTVTQNFHVRSDTVLNAGEVAEMINDSVDLAAKQDTGLSLLKSDTITKIPTVTQLSDSLDSWNNSLAKKITATDTTWWGQSTDTTNISLRIDSCLKVADSTDYITTHAYQTDTAGASNTGTVPAYRYNYWNAKQNALTNPVTGTGTSDYIPIFTGTNTIGQSVLSVSGSSLTVGNLDQPTRLYVKSSTTARDQGVCLYSTTTLGGGIQYWGSTHATQNMRNKFLLFAANGIYFGKSVSSYEGDVKTFMSNTGNWYYFLNKGLYFQATIGSNTTNDKKWSASADYRAIFQNYSGGDYGDSVSISNAGVINVPTGGNININNVPLINGISGYMLHANGTSTSDTSNLFWSGSRLGLGTESPRARLHLVSQGAVIYSDSYHYTDVNTITFRSAEGTLASPTATPINRVLGGIVGRGYYTDGTPEFSSKNTAAMLMYAAENYTSTAQGSYIVFGTTPTGSTTRAERMRIASDGNVGILTTNPGKTLEINSATGDNLRLTYNDADGSASNYADFNVSSGGNLTINPSGRKIIIYDEISMNTATEDRNGITIDNSASSNKYGITVNSGSASSTGIVSSTNSNNQDYGYAAKFSSSEASTAVNVVAQKSSVGIFASNSTLSPSTFPDTDYDSTILAINAIGRCDPFVINLSTPTQTAPVSNNALLIKKNLVTIAKVDSTGNGYFSGGLQIDANDTIFFGSDYLTGTGSGMITVGGGARIYSEGSLELDDEITTPEVVTDQISLNYTGSPQIAMTIGDHLGQLTINEASNFSNVEIKADSIELTGNITTTGTINGIKFLFVSDTLSSASILAGTVKQIIAAPGSGKYIKIISADLFYKHGGTDYVGAYTPIIDYVSSLDGKNYESYIAINSSTSCHNNLYDLAIMEGGSGAPSNYNIENKGIYLGLNNTPTTGNGYLKIDILYTINDY